MAGMTHHGIRTVAWQAVQPAATALRLSALFGFACTVALLAFICVRISLLPPGNSPTPRPTTPLTDEERQKQRSEPLPPHLQQADILYGACLLAVVFPCWSLVILLGARQMRRLDHYESARMACILALLPLNAAWVVGVPVGIWGLRVLKQPGIRDAFARATGRPGVLRHGPGKE